MVLVVVDVRSAASKTCPERLGHFIGKRGTGWTGEAPQRHGRPGAGSSNRCREGVVQNGIGGK